MIGHACGEVDQRVDLGAGWSGLDQVGDFGGAPARQECERLGALVEGVGGFAFAGRGRNGGDRNGHGNDMAQPRAQG